MKTLPKKIAATYARVSSDKQKEDKTIESQTALIRDYAQENDYSIPTDYVLEDNGYSGDMLARPGLERLRDLAAEKHIDAVIIYCPDRLSRRYAYQVLLIEEFHKNGVEVLFIKSVKGETPEERLLLQFQGIIAEYERAQIMERSRRGKRHKAKQGCVNVLSNAPYGYKYIKKTEYANAAYQINETEAMIVQEIFASYTQDLKAIGEIARELTQRGVLTKTGKTRWERSVIWAILRNPAYTGKAAFGKTESCQRQRITRALRQKGGFSPRSSANKERPKSEWIFIPVPPLISEEQFELAAERLRKNKQLASKNTKEYALLQGIAHCRECGYSYYLTSTQTTKRKIRYYRCFGSDDYRHENGRVCKTRPIRQDDLDELVWQQIMKLLQEPSLIESELKRRLEKSKDSNPTRKRQKNLQRQLSKLQRAKDKLLDAYQEDLIKIEELRTRMEGIRQRESSLQSELESIGLQMVQKQQHAELQITIAEFLESVRENAQSLDVESRQKIARLLIKDVEIGRDSIKINHCIPLSKKNSNSTESVNYPLCTGRALATAGEHLSGSVGQRTGAKRAIVCALRQR